MQTYEVLSGDGQLAIAMEYLDGQPLTRVLTRLLRGPNALSLPLRLRILTSVLAGLEHAHTLTDLDGTPLEVVHRDVSPQNVFVTYDGQVKLVDFGVAKTLAASHHTRPGAIKGKLAYMAPEQLQRATVDRRADLFSVGVMLWEMLAARRMWHGKTEVEIVESPGVRPPLPPLPLDASLPAGARRDLHARARSRSRQALPDGRRIRDRAGRRAGRRRGLARAQPGQGGVAGVRAGAGGAAGGDRTQPRTATRSRRRRW